MRTIIVSLLFTFTIFSLSTHVDRRPHFLSMSGQLQDYIAFMDQETARDYNERLSFP